MKKIAIFGTTADPFTKGHFEIVKESIKRFDEVIIVPTSVRYYKKSRQLFSFSERVDIITYLISSLKNIKISRIEEDKDDNWRAIDTIAELMSEDKDAEYYYIIGQDSYENFKTWYRYRDILNLVTLVVVPRGEGQLQADSEIPFELLEISKKFNNSSATKVRQKLIDEIKRMYLESFEYFY